MAEQNIDDKENKAIETDKEIILEVKDVKKWFPNAAKSKEYIKAVDGVSQWIMLLFHWTGER